MISFLIQFLIWKGWEELQDLRARLKQMQGIREGLGNPRPPGGILRAAYGKPAELGGGRAP